MLFEMIGYSARNFAVNQTAKLNCGLLKTKLSSLAGPPPLTALSSRRTITPCNKRKIDTECIFNRCIRCLYFTTIREIVQNKALNVPVECLFVFQGSRGHSFCPSIGSQREGSFFNPLNENFSKNFLGTKKAADFISKPAA